MPEDNDGKHGTAKDKAETPQKKKQMVQQRVRTSKRNWDVRYSQPEGDLHAEKNTDHHKIRVDVRWKLHSRRQHHLAKFPAIPAQ